MGKFVFCAFLILAASAASAEKSAQIPRIDEHNIVRCKSTDPTNWKTLDSGTVLADGHPGEIVERTIIYPTFGAVKETITCIRVLDLVGDGNGGFPYIVQNGIDFHDVTITFKSKRSYGFKFSVEILGE